MNALLHTSSPDLRLRFATVQDVDLVLQFIQGLAAYEKLSHEVPTLPPCAAPCSARVPPPRWCWPNTRGNPSA